jgi:short subunit dehydrogenase-like uncharacterized protein
MFGVFFLSLLLCSAFSVFIFKIFFVCNLFNPFFHSFLFYFCPDCDITGELSFVREMIAVHDDAARKSGSRIVHLCGHDSIPWDLSTLLLHQKLQAKGGADTQLKRVDFFTDIKSAPSGGTLETASGIMFGAEGKAKPHPSIKALGFDPLLKTPEGSKSTTNLSAKNVDLLAMGAAKLSKLSKQVRGRRYS